MRPVPVLLALSLGGCAPPPEVLLYTPSYTDTDPTIDLLYPEPGQVIELDGDCSLSEPIVVAVTGILLTDWDASPIAIERQGHWHGGPDLDGGYCRSYDNSCDDYVATDMSEGPINLYVGLFDNTHAPLGAEDQVEIELEAPVGVDCP